MNTSDRTEYEQMFEEFCAGMGVMVTDARREGYWKGLAKMSLIQFGRCIEYCLSEEGPAKMPNAPGVWVIWRMIQAQSRRQSVAQVEEKLPDLSFGMRLVNQMFFAYLHRRRVVDGFRGDLRIASRRAKCIELGEWWDGMKAEAMLPTLAECKEAFAHAMERIEDGADAGHHAETTR